jgi:hypothetical protein
MHSECFFRIRADMYVTHYSENYKMIEESSSKSLLLIMTEEDFSGRLSGLRTIFQGGFRAVERFTLCIPGVTKGGFIIDFKRTGGLSHWVLRIGLWICRENSPPRTKKPWISCSENKPSGSRQNPSGRAHGCQREQGPAYLFTFTQHYNRRDEHRIAYVDPYKF